MEEEEGGAEKGPMKRSLNGNIELKDTLQNYMFVLPAILLFAMFYIYPVFNVFNLSLHEYDGISPEKFFVGFGNFIEGLQNPIWWSSMWNATYITILTLVFQNGLALMLAIIVDKGIRGGKFYRVVFFLPPVLSGIVTGLIWKWIYNGEYGLLNHWLSMFGLGNLARAWTADPKTALTCVGIIHMWKGFGWGFVILLAGLQNIPRELYEAAKIDGAGSWDTFLKVTIPLMIPVFILVAILTVLNTMQIFDIIISTTGGGPGYHTEVPVTRIIAQMLYSSRFGYACSLGLIFGAILLFVSGAQLKISNYLKQT